MDGNPLQKEQQVMIPERSLVVLCGPAGAGKSTFARSFIAQQQPLGYKSTAIVSSDFCRAMVCDDENNQQVNRDTFDLFYYIMHKRMFQGRLTVADSTALQPDSRHKLLELAQRHHYFTCLIVFNMSLQTCMAYDQHVSRGRTVGEQVIQYHLKLLQQALQVIPTEGWQQVHMLDEQQSLALIAVTPQDSSPGN